MLPNTDRLSEIIKSYELVSPQLMQVGKITTTSLANIVDVECRLDYCVQVSNNVIYFYNLSTHNIKYSNLFSIVLFLNYCHITYFIIKYIGTKYII